MVVAGSNGPSGRQMSTCGGKRDVEKGAGGGVGDGHERGWRTEGKESEVANTGLMGARATERAG